MCPDNSEMYAKYFDTVYADSNLMTKAHYEKTAKEYDELYQNILPENEDSNILDIGCGTGHFLYYLEKKGYKNNFGIDISRQQIKFCKENITKKVKNIDAFEFLDRKENRYDVIAAHDLLEHIPKNESIKLMKLVYHSLSSQGCFIVRVPNMSNPFSSDSRYRDFTHELGYTEKSLAQALKVSGFKKIEIFSSRTKTRSLKNKVRYLLVAILHRIIRFLLYIQDYSVPNNLGKNLIAICKKQ